MKYRVLLVDDEQIYLQYLQGVMDWEAYECRICGCAMNGEEALGMAEEKQPDIIFMDINMSQMNGLDVCEILRERKCNAKIIIMTAYNEFSFAHRAIKLNVVDYLLKPFDETELSRTLQKCMAEIKKEREYKKDQKELFFKKLLDYGVSGDELKQMEERIAGHSYLAVLFRKKQEVPYCEREAFCKLLQCYFARVSVENYFLGNQKGYGIIIHGMMQEQVPQEEIKGIYERLISEHPEEEFQWVAIGNVVDGIEKLPETYQNAQTVQENRVKVEGAVISLEDIEALSREIALPNTSDITLLIKAFERKDYQEVDQRIERMFALSRNQMFSFQYVVNAYYTLVTGIYEYYQYKGENNLMDMQETQSNLISEISLCATAQQMLEIVRNYVYEVFCDCMQVRVGSKKKMLVAKIEAYLQQHYGEQSLSVNQIAENLFFENSYIRRVFKIQTGKTIIQRLEEIRLEKARQLLLEGGYKNSEIAELTGYCDQYYFSKRFKLFFGCSPTEYQRREWVETGEMLYRKETGKEG